MSSKNKKIVKASDASFIKRQLKKIAPLQEDLTTKELKKLSKVGKGGLELQSRTKNLRKAYKDKILRENIKGTSGDTSGIFFPFAGEDKPKQSEIRKVKKKAMGGDLKTEYRGGGMVNLGNFKGQF